MATGLCMPRAESWDPEPMTSAPDRPPAWVADAVFYQIFPDRFARSGRVPAPGPLEPWDVPPTVHGFKGGDLPGIVERLDHLVDLGVTAIYLNPIFSSAANHRYHTYDYFAVDPLLGGDDALRELLEAAHARGLRVVLDGVFNHASRGFWPFHHVLEVGKASPYRDWFHLDRDDLEAGRPLRAYPSEMSATAADPEWAELHAPGTDSLTTLGYRAWWDLPALPKLNTDNRVVREYLMRVAEHWTRFGIDGWRLDVPGEITTPGFWEEFRARIRAIEPDAYIVGEIWQERGDLLTGATYDGLMNYPLGAAIASFVSGRHLDARVVSQHGELARQVRPVEGAGFLDRLASVVSEYAEPFARSMLNLLDSHDTPRFLTMAGGDRTSLQLGWLVLLTMPGAPSIYYGDEIGMQGEQDPGCRGAFPWDESRWDRALLDTLRGLIALRKATPAVREAEFTPLASAGMAAAYLRGSGPGALAVAINAGEAPAVLDADLPRGADVAVAGLRSGIVESQDGRTRFSLPPRSASVLRID
jgi:cyclomaltodextrinase / maltogenic alpha-amylase / neopullulanase